MIALNSNDNERMQSINSTETYAHEMRQSILKKQIKTIEDQGEKQKRHLKSIGSN